MRICLISREYPPETGFGGIATFTQHLAHGLKNLGHEVVVVALAKENAKVVDDNGVTIHRVPLYPFKSKLAVVAMCMPYTKYVFGAATALWDKFYELHAQKPFDVVDTPELLAEGIYPAVTQVAPLVIRLYTPHSKFIAEKLHNVVPSFDHQFVAALERVAMLSADVLTSPSLDLAEFVAGDLGTAVSDIKLVRNPIDTGVFVPEGELALPRTDKLRVLFVGRLEERKGIPYLVEAIPQVVARFKNVEFVIIGDDTKTGKGGASVLESLKHSLAESGCDKYVTFIDRIALSALPSYYRSADISMVPSVYDNSPYTSLEAMACGVPVIGSSAGGTKEYVIDGKTGVIIPPRDSQAIAQALLRLLENEAERKTMAANARTHAVESFDRTEIARQTALLYEEARGSFKARQEASFSRKLYHHDLEHVTGSATHFLDSFDKALYDMLYQQSIRFRIVHWWRLGKARPKLLGAKLVNRLGRSIMRVFGTRDENMPQSLKQLEGSIIEKDKERQNHELAGRKN
jgi:glycosyltransferase involved in cell wall biosynthesis